MLRRVFLARLTQFFGALITVLFSLPLIKFLTASEAEEASSAFYPVANLSSLTEEVTSIRYARLIREGWLKRMVEETVWLSKQTDGSYAAFEPHCTHLGCAYSWSAEKSEFQCPCHGGKFDQSGKKIAGPPPRPLDRYEIRIDGDVVQIGKLKQ